MTGRGDDGAGRRRGGATEWWGTGAVGHGSGVTRGATSGATERATERGSGATKLGHGVRQRAGQLIGTVGQRSGATRWGQADSGATEFCNKVGRRTAATERGAGVWLSLATRGGQERRRGREGLRGDGVWQRSLATECGNAWGPGTAASGRQAGGKGGGRKGRRAPGRARAPIPCFLALSLAHPPVPPPHTHTASRRQAGGKGGGRKGAGAGPRTRGVAEPPLSRLVARSPTRPPHTHTLTHSSPPTRAHARTRDMFR